MTVKYRNMYGVGATSDPWENAPLEEFVRIAPHLGYIIIVNNILPPIAVLNDFFKKGDDNAGMGGSIIWKPFKIDKNEYNDLVEILCTDPNLDISQDETHNEITQFKLWVKKIIQEKKNKKVNKSLREK